MDQRGMPRVEIFIERRLGFQPLPLAKVREDEGRCPVGTATWLGHTFAPWKLYLGTAASGTRGILQHQPIKIIFLQWERREQKERREQM